MRPASDVLPWAYARGPRHAYRCGVSSAARVRLVQSLPDRPPWLTAGAGIAWGVTAVAAVGAAADLAASGPGHRTADAVSWSLYAVTVLALLARSVRPVPVALVTGAAGAGWALYGHTGELLNLPVIAALYSLAALGDRRRTVRAALVAAPASGLVSLLAGAHTAQPEGAPALEAAWPLIPLLLGEVVRGRRELTASYAERAARAEQERDREAACRVQEERVRIARELHDIVAHTVSAMTVQSGVALDALERRPDMAREALRQVRASGREAVRELRAAVGVLREPAPAPEDRLAVPGLAQLEELAARATGAEGPRVTLRLDAPRALPPLVELAAYRIAQEALTNVVRHARAARRVTVEVTADAGSLGIRVTDDGNPADRAGPPGHGLLGMRERAAAAGGTLEAGPLPGGGWQVRASLPLAAGHGTDPAGWAEGAEGAEGVGG